MSTFSERPQAGKPAAAIEVTDSGQVDEANAEARIVEAEAQYWEDLIEQRKRYGKWMLIGMAAQLVVANTVFILYCTANAWNISPTSIDVWLGATVVEIIGVVLAITRSIFPPEPLPPRRRFRRGARAQQWPSLGR